MVRCDHAPLWKFVYSVTKTDKENNWSQKIHAIIPHIESKHIKGKENILANSLSRLRWLGLHDDNDLEKPGQEYGKSIFDMDGNMVNSTDGNENSNNTFKIDGGQYFLDKKHLANTHASATGTNSLPQACNENMVNSIDSNQNSNNTFKIDGRQYFLDKKHLANTHARAKGTKSLPQACNLDPEKRKQLQQQDKYITKLLNAGLPKIMRHPIFWMSMALLIERSEKDLIFSMQLWSLMLCNHIFYTKATMH